MSLTSSSTNVLAFPLNRIARPQANPAAARFVEEARTLMLEQTGLDYLKVKEALHGPGKNFMEFVRDGLDKGASPAEFVEFTVKSNGLASVGPQMDLETAAAYNQVQMALIEFANEDPNWNRGWNGSIVSCIQLPDGAIVSYAEMAPIKHNVSPDYGVAIQVFDRGMDSENDEMLKFNQTPSKAFRGWDIEDPLDEYEAYRASFQNDQVAYIR